MSLTHRLRKPATVAAIGLIAVASLTACGKKSSGGATASGNLDLAASISKLSEGTGASITIKLNDPTGTLAKALAKDSKASDVAMQKRVLAGSIRISFAGHAGAKLNDKKAQHDFQIELLEGSTPDFSLAVVGSDLYAHLDSAFLKQVGGDKAIQGISQFAPALATGGTVKIAGILSTLKGIAEKAGAKPTATPSIDAQSYARSIRAAASSAVTVKSHNGDTYTVGVDVHTLLTSIYSVIKPLAASAGQFGGSQLANADKGLSAIPNGEVTGTVTVSGGALKQIALDGQSIVDLVAKADPAKATDKPIITGSQLVIDFDNSASINAPSDATTIDIAKIFGNLIGGGLSAGLGGSTSGSSSTSLPPCSAIPPSLKGKIPCK